MRASMTVVATVLGLLSVPGSASAQLGGDPEMHRREMERLEFLVGEWEGDGWILDRIGRIEIRQSEVVRYELPSSPRAVTTPTTFPWISISGPPEFPGPIGAEN